MPLTAAIVGSVAAPIIGGYIGNEQAKGSQEEAQRARQAALAAYAGIKLPDIQQQQLALETTGAVGQYNPELEHAINLGPSAMEGIALDPALRQAQMEALSQISGISKGQMTPADMAALEIARRNAAAESQAQQQAVLQNMQQRGQGGSGNELIARLKASQASADRLAQENLATAQAVQQRALQALAQKGALGGQIRGQEFNEQSDVARAKDVINQYNVANQQKIQGSNVGSLNQAQLRNLQEKQRLAEQAAAIHNYQQEKNKGLYQTQYQNQLQKAGGMAREYGQQADAANTQAGRTAEMWSKIGQGVGTGLAGIAKPAAKTVPNAVQYPYNDEEETV